MATKTSKRPLRVRVGDRVTIRFAGRDSNVEIIEDRGRIGYQGRRLWRIRTLHGDPDVPEEEFEVPEENIIAVKHSRVRRR